MFGFAGNMYCIPIDGSSPPISFGSGPYSLETVEEEVFEETNEPIHSWSLFDNRTVTFGCDLAADPASIFSINYEPSKTKIDMTFEAEMRVPARYHRQRRIQKKWIKKYGHVTRYAKITMRGCEFQEATGIGNLTGNISGRPQVSILRTKNTVYNER